MLPETFTEVTEIVDMPSKTFKIDWENNHISGFIDGKEAIKQSIELSVSTERYIWQIYSWNYGSEIYTLIGQSDAYAMSEMKRMIQDALVNDSRIKELTEFVFERVNKGVSCEFVAKTTVGDVNGTV